MCHRDGCLIDGTGLMLLSLVPCSDGIYVEESSIGRLPKTIIGRSNESSGDENYAEDYPFFVYISADSFVIGTDTACVRSADAG
jgi:hypothetical protein